MTEVTSSMDGHRLYIRGFLRLGLIFFILICPALSKILGIESEENLRQRSNSRIYWLRGYEGTHLRNHRDRFDQDCNVRLQAEPLQIACFLKHLEKTGIISKNLRQFSKKGTPLNSARWIQNIGSLFEHNLAKGINKRSARPNRVLRDSLDGYAVVPFVSSDVNGGLIRPVSGKDEGSNLPWPVERLRDLLAFHFDEKRLLLSRSVETPAISPIAAIAPSPSAQNDYYQSPAPSPEKLIPQLGTSPLPGTGVDPGRQSVIPVSPPEQSVKNSDNSKTVILAVVITAISTLLFSGLCFCFYLKYFSNRHQSNHPNDNKPLLLSSLHSGSLNHYYGEPNGFSWATIENANGISHNSAFSETGKADGKQLSSFSRKTLRVLSLPSRFRNSTKLHDFHPLLPLPKTKASLELCDEDTFKSSASKAGSLSTHLSQGLQMPSSVISSMSPLVSYDSISQPTDVFCASHSQSIYPSAVSSTHPPSVNRPLQPLGSTSVHHPIPPPSKSPPALPPPSTSPLPQSKSPPHPPPPPPSKSPPPPPPPSKPPPPPPPMHNFPPPPPPAPANGKSNVPTAPLPPVRTSQSPPVLPPRSKAGQPIPPGSEHENGDQRPKLKPFHWDKVQANADHSMVWDQIRAGSFQFNEEMIETLFGYNSTNAGTSRVAKQAFTPNQNIQLLDPKKSQNLAILLRALSVRREEVYDALLEGENLSSQLLEALIKMAPTRDEEKKLKEYTGDISKLGPAESFLKELLGIPSVFERMDKMLYRKNFKEEISCIRKSFETLEAACKELKSSRLFLKLLEAVLKTGNRMNVGTFRGGAQAFKLDTLLKLSDVKGTDGKTTLLHFVVQEIIRAEGVRAARTSQQSGPDTTSSSLDGKNISPENKDDYYRTLGLQVLANLSSDFSNVRNAATIDSDALISSISKLVTGLTKLRSFLQRDFGSQPTETSSKQGNFYLSMTLFLHQAEDEIQQIQSEEKRIFSHVKDIPKYFHGDAAKEEAHPFRIFVIVKDFTGMLDQVCKEVSKMQKQNPPTASQKASSSVFLKNVPQSLFPNSFARNAGGFDDDSTSE